MRWLDRMVEKIQTQPAPFDCGWCDGESRHDMCTGVAVLPHREFSIWDLERATTKVTDCLCALRGHVAPTPARLRYRFGKLGW